MLATDVVAIYQRKDDVTNYGHDNSIVPDCDVIFSATIMALSVARA